MNGVIIPSQESVSVRTYRNASNSTVIVRRIGKYIRQFEVWNTALDDIVTITLDPEDRPATAFDSNAFITDNGKVGRIRINGQNGTITGWVLDSYNGTFITSSSSKTFFNFVYLANATE